MARNIHVIVNPASGQGEQVLRILNQAFKDADIVWDVSVTMDKGDCTRFAEEALKRDDLDMIATYGGDGTVGEAINALVGTDMPLAVLGGGTGNAFARSLTIPLELEDAAALVADESAYKFETIDTGTVNGELKFMVGGATGLIAEALRNASREEKDKMGMRAYTLSALREILKAEPMDYRLILDDEEENVSGVSCFVTNAGHIGISNISFFNELDLKDGKLDVYLIEGNNVGALLNSLVDASPLKIPGLEMPHWAAQSVRIESTNSNAVFFFDGNETVNLPVEVTVQPSSLKVLVPANWESTGQRKEKDKAKDEKTKEKDGGKKAE